MQPKNSMGQTLVSYKETLNKYKFKLVKLFSCFLCFVLLFFLLEKCDNAATSSFVGLAILTALSCWVAWGSTARRLNSALFWLIPCISYFIVEGFFHSPIGESHILTILFNLLLYYAVYVLTVFITKNNGFAAIALGVFSYSVGLANYLVIAFRQSPILPWDLLSVGTAVKVVNNYTFPITSNFVFLTAWFLIVLFFGVSNLNSVRTFKNRSRIIGAGLTSLILICSVFFIQSSAFPKCFYINDSLFSPINYYRINGYAVGFVRAFKFLNVEKPSDYSSDAVINILQDYSRAEPSEPEQYPNIIVIMNETFSDLSVLGEFSTNEEYLPYWSSLSDNVVKGDLHVSVKGGNTANAEFEFLTGNSMAFLPTGSVPYVQYIRSSTPSIASYLKDNFNYKTYSVHPFISTAWNRDKIYPLLGFDKSIFLDDFSHKNNIIRNFASDTACYEEIIDMVENKPVNERFFCFCVTLQNHGGYDVLFDNFQPSVFVEGLEDDVSLNQYLSLIKESDKAFQSFIEYFKNIDEPTVILMFGDHQPTDSAIQALLNKVDYSPSDLEAFEKQYITEFAIWANYDIDEKNVKHTSCNFLSSMLFDVAGIPLFPYQEFLSELRSEYPVITANCVIDKNGNYFYKDALLKQSSFLKYSKLQYFYLFDSDK